MWSGGWTEEVAFLDPEQEGLFRAGKTSSGRVGKEEATRITWPPGHTNRAAWGQAHLIRSSQPPREADLASVPPCTDTGPGRRELTDHKVRRDEPKLTPIISVPGGLFLDEGSSPGGRACIHKQTFGHQSCVLPRSCFWGPRGVLGRHVRLSQGRGK